MSDGNTNTTGTKEFERTFGLKFYPEAIGAPVPEAAASGKMSDAEMRAAQGVGKTYKYQPAAAAVSKSTPNNYLARLEASGVMGPLQDITSNIRMLEASMPADLRTSGKYKNDFYASI